MSLIFCRRRILSDETQDPPSAFVRSRLRPKPPTNTQFRYSAKNGTYYAYRTKSSPAYPDGRNDRNNRPTTPSHSFG